MSEKFWKLVREACQVEAEYREHMQHTRLTADAIIDGCLQRCGSSRERLDELRKTLEERRNFMQQANGFVFRAQKWFESGRVTGGIPDSSTRMAIPGRDEAQVELGGQWSLYELWSIACANASKRHPEVFRSITDLDEWKAKAKKLSEQRQALFARIGREYGHDDLIIGGVRGDGSALISFKLGGVPLAPTENAGERLITHLLQEDPSWGDLEAPQLKRQKVATG